MKQIVTIHLLQLGVAQKQDAKRAEGSLSVEVQ